MELLECVPNISEGNNLEVISKLQQEIEGVDGVKLLHTDTGNAANRTVFSFIGHPECVVEAAFLLFQRARELLSMEHHVGEHPRVGIVDVCPLIPVHGISIEKTRDLAEMLAQRVGEELQIPVYLYEYNAKYVYRTRLEQIRLGEYEGFAQKMTLDGWQPDYGPRIFNPKTGISVIGARNFLLAYNVNLRTKNIQIAKSIAAQIRESGGKYIAADGEKCTSLGSLKGVKAIGWYIKDFDIVQVSTNITDFHLVSMFRVYKEIQSLAREYGTEVCGSELIGLVPYDALFMSGHEIVHEGIQQGDDKVQIAIDVLGLQSLKECVPHKQILEFACGFYNI